MTTAGPRRRMASGVASGGRARPAGVSEARAVCRTAGLPRAPVRGSPLRRTLGPCSLRGGWTGGPAGRLRAWICTCGVQPPTICGRHATSDRTDAFPPQAEPDPETPPQAEDAPGRGRLGGRKRKSDGGEPGSSRVALNSRRPRVAPLAVDLLSFWSASLARVTGGACTPSGAAQRGAVLLFARFRRTRAVAASSPFQVPLCCEPLDEPLDVDTLLVHAAQPVGSDQVPQLAASLWCVSVCVWIVWGTWPEQRARTNADTTRPPPLSSSSRTRLALKLLDHQTGVAGAHAMCLATGLYTPPTPQARDAAAPPQRQPPGSHHAATSASAEAAPHAPAVKVLRAAEAEVGTALRWSLAAGMDIVCPACHLPSQEGCGGDAGAGRGDELQCGSRGRSDCGGSAASLPDTPPHWAVGEEAWFDCRSRGSSASSGGGEPWSW
jgi:hypothetical protein